MSSLKPTTRDKLQAISTATVATALFKRGFRNQAIQNVHPLSPVQRAGRPGLHLALHAGARGPEQAGSVPRPRPSAAQSRGLSARRRAGDGQPQGRARGVGRRDPGDAADEARRGGRGDRRRLPRFRRKSPGWASRLSPAAQRTHQPHPAPGDRHRRTDGSGDAPVFPGDTILGDGDNHGHPREPGRRHRRGGLRDDGVRRFVAEPSTGATAFMAFIRRPPSRRWSTSRPGGR